jgi:hypothetical protein
VFSIERGARSLVIARSPEKPTPIVADDRRRRGH